MVCALLVTKIDVVFQEIFDVFKASIHMAMQALASCGELEAYVDDVEHRYSKFLSGSKLLQYITKALGRTTYKT